MQGVCVVEGWRWDLSLRVQETRNGVWVSFQMGREELAVQRARRSFQTGKTKPLGFRLQQLKNLLRFISERRKEIAAAVKKDLGKVCLGPQEEEQRCSIVWSVVMRRSSWINNRSMTWRLFSERGWD